MRGWSRAFGYREAVGLMVGGCIALICGLYFAISGAGALIQEYRFFTNSEAGVAEVTGKERTGPNGFVIDCRLLAAGNSSVVYKRTIPVYFGLWQALRKGQTVNVTYLRTDPANLRLQGSIGDLGDAFLHFLVGLFLLIIGLAAAKLGRTISLSARLGQGSDEPDGLPSAQKNSAGRGTGADKTSGS
jgi:hypothetical protein